MMIIFPAHAEKIIIVAEDDWSPYSSIKADKSGPQGLTPELVTKAFKLQGIEVQYVTLPFTRCMYYTLIGKNVGCFNATITTENRNQFYWHSPPLFKEGVSVFAQANSTANDVKIKDMEGKTVAYTIGYTYSPEILQNKKIKAFGAISDQHQLNMLAAGRIQYALINTTPGTLTINKDAALRGKVKIVGHLSDDAFYIAFSKKHPDGKRLMQEFESGFEQLKASGEYSAMMQNFQKQYSLKSPAILTAASNNTSAKSPMR